MNNTDSIRKKNGIRPATLLSFMFGAVTGGAIKGFVDRNKRRLSLGVLGTLFAGSIGYIAVDKIIPSYLDSQNQRTLMQLQYQHQKDSTEIAFRIRMLDKGLLIDTARIGEDYRRKISAISDDYSSKTKFAEQKYLDDVNSMRGRFNEEYLALNRRNDSLRDNLESIRNGGAAANKKLADEYAGRIAAMKDEYDAKINSLKSLYGNSLNFAEVKNSELEKKVDALNQELNAKRILPRISQNPSSKETVSKEIRVGQREINHYTNPEVLIKKSSDELEVIALDYSGAQAILYSSPIAKDKNGGPDVGVYEIYSIETRDGKLAPMVIKFNHNKPLQVLSGEGSNGEYSHAIRNKIDLCNNGARPLNRALYTIKSLYDRGKVLVRVMP